MIPDLLTTLAAALGFYAVCVLAAMVVGVVGRRKGGRG
jgi:hypothetical protein